MVANALAGFQMRLRLGVERVPLLLPVIDHRRPIDLGQAVEVGHLEAGLTHGLQHRGGRRSGRGEEAHDVRQGPLLVLAAR